MAIEATRKCPFCGNGEADLLKEMLFCHEEGFPFPDRFGVGCCVRCGFIYHCTEAVPEDFRTYYTTQAKYTLAGIGGAGDGRDRVRYEAVFQRIKDFISTDDEVVDIGCGCGGLLGMLRERHFRHLYGIDASPGCVDSLRRLGIDGEVRILEAVEETARRFDVVLLSHVAEHLYDPERLFAGITRMLNPSGVFYVEVPDASRYRDYPAAPFHYFDFEHINHFSRAYLEHLLRRSGFHLLVSGCSTMKIVPDVEYPICFAVGRTGADAASSGAGIVDPELRCSVQDYLEASEARGRAMRIPEHVKNGKMFIWGMGAYGKRLLNTPELKKIGFTAIIDIDPGKQGGTIGGCRICLPEILMRENEPENCVIISSVLYHKQIRRLLQDMGWRGSILNFS